MAQNLVQIGAFGRSRASTNIFIPVFIFIDMNRLRLRFAACSVSSLLVPVPFARISMYLGGNFGQFGVSLVENVALKKEFTAIDVARRAAVTAIVVSIGHIHLFERHSLSEWRNSLARIIGTHEIVK